MRVLLLSKALIAAAYRRKAELLAARPDIDLTVVVPPMWRDGSIVRRLEPGPAPGYRIVETPIVRPGDFHLHFYPRLGSVFDRARPAVAHIDEEPYNLATYLALRAARRAGCRALFFTWQNLARRYPPPFSLFERHAYRRCRAAIAGSRTAAEVLRGKGYTGPLWVIPQFGVDAEAFRPPERPRPDRPFTVGYAGRLVPAKGVDLLVDALAGLPGEWRLDLVGDGEARTDLAARAERAGLADRLSIRDWLSSTEMPGFYRNLDALVLPSRSTPRWIEQFGRVLVEAMACSVPCIGSDSGEIPHVLGDAGLVFPEGDADALRIHLARLASDPGLSRRLGDAGRQRVLARFTMERVADETALVYRSVAGA